MKKSLLILFSFLFCGFCFSQENLKSDIAIFKDITQSFENQFYPGTIQNVELLQQKYPDSVFIQQALVYKAHSLVNLKCYDDAIETLTNAITHMHTGQKGFTECHYLLGLSYFYLENFEKASECFYVSTQLADLDKDKYHYAYSIFFFAESYYNLNRFNEIYPIYEYVIEHGKDYSVDDYNIAVQKLLICYNKSGLYKKTIDLYEALDKSFFEKDIKSIIQLYAAEAYENTGKYEKAYNLYCDVITSENEELAVIALKNAYNLSDSKKIDVNPGNVFSQSTSTFNNQDLVNEFWIRLGIDEYNKKHYVKAGTYFDNVKEPLAIISLYKAKIILDTDDSAEGGKKAEEILISIKNINDNKFIKNLTDTYYSLLLQSAVQQEKWDSVPSIFRNIKTPDKQAIYINSSYYYRKGEYEKVSPKSGVLYGSSLSKLGKYDDACKVFKSLDDNGELDKRYLIEYAKALFLAEKYDDAYNIASRSVDKDKNYILGLCKINTGDFETGRKHLIAYIKEMSGKEGFNKLALYYKGLCEYSIEDYKNAYVTFVRFGEEGKNQFPPYNRKAHYYAAISALQNKDYNNAAIQGVKVIENSSNEEEKFNATIFTTEILSDFGKYEQAIQLLLPYTEKKSPYTVEALFKLARIFEKQGDLVQADLTYSRVVKEYPRTDFAEEAMYNNAEVFYFKEDYSTAYKKFNDYIAKYVSGRFLDGALYFSGDCALKVGEINKSIMINKNMVAKFPDSVYTYGAYKNLLESYYQSEDYTNALEIASFIVSNFSEQSAADSIGSKLIELEKIVKGSDRRVVEKLSQFEKAGGTKTKAGRKLGYELVKLYGENTYTQKYGFELAEHLLKIKVSGDELEHAGETAEFAGDYLRTKQDNKKAAAYYLQAAEYYKSVDNSLKAAAVLYSATEAFVASGLMGDAASTADLLKELYPDTKYAEKVEKIVR